MRRRERERVERRTRALLASHVGTAMAKALAILWARRIPDARGLAWYETRPRVMWIMYDEGWLGRASASERRELIAHEVAHLLAYHFHGEGIKAHGAEWRRWAARLHGSPLRA